MTAPVGLILIQPDRANQRRPPYATTPTARPIPQTGRSISVTKYGGNPIPVVEPRIYRVHFENYCHPLTEGQIRKASRVFMGLAHSIGTRSVNP